MAPLRDLELMIQSHYPLIAIETSEEDFVDLPTAVERKEIFAVHLQKRKRGLAAFDLDRLAAAAGSPPTSSSTSCGRPGRCRSPARRRSTPCARGLASAR